jgi:hypothetical protein
VIKTSISRGELEKEISSKILRFGISEVMENSYKNCRAGIE